MIYSIKASRSHRTTFSGDRVVFRSLLEARWSLVFDMLHLEWEYEPKTFALPSGRLYTPDFHVEGVWIEIKPMTAALFDVAPKLGEFARSGLPDGERFFSVASDKPSFGFRSVVEWMPDGVRFVPAQEVVRMLCAEHGFRKKYPSAYELHVRRSLEIAGDAGFDDPVHISELVGVDRWAA